MSNMLPDVLSELPPETVITIFSYLPVPTLAALHSVSRRWHLFLTIHAAQIWRNAAISIGYADAENGPDLESEVAARRTSNGAFLGTSSWRELCCRQWTLDRNWSSRRPYCTHRFIQGAPTRRDIWRIKLDQTEQTLISTGMHGGVRVVALEDSKLLWEIPRRDTRNHAHLEFSDGWMIFDRFGLAHFEVWRSERIALSDRSRTPDSDGASSVHTDSDDEDVFWGRLTDEESDDDSVRPRPVSRAPGEEHAQPRRGHFVRYAILSSPLPIRAYRFQFPHLMAATLDGHVCVWNVPDKELIQIFDISSVHTVGNIENVTYIDFDADHVFLVGDGIISIWRRSDGQLAINITDKVGHWPYTRTWKTGRLGQTFTPMEPTPREWLGEDGDSDPLLPPQPADIYHLEAPAVEGSGGEAVYFRSQPWQAIHVDQQGNLVVLSAEGLVLIFHDYRTLIQKHPQHIFEQARALKLWNGRRAGGNLAVDNGRAVVAGASIHVLTLSDFLETPYRVQRLPMRKGPPVSCVQMDRSAIYMTSSPGDDLGVDVTALEFAPARCAYPSSEGPSSPDNLRDDVSALEFRQRRCAHSSPEDSGEDSDAG